MSQKINPNTDKRDVEQVTNSAVGLLGKSRVAPDMALLWPEKMESSLLSKQSINGLCVNQ